MPTHGAPFPQSIKDFRSDDELKAVLAKGLRCRDQESETEAATSRTPWLLSKENFDASTMKDNTISIESTRLHVLKSLLVLDETDDEGLDRLTGMASRLFHVPTCLVSLVDLGRLWFISNTGLGEVRSIGRMDSLCEYAMQNKGDVFIVPDTTKCPIFQNNPIVCGPPNVRFYAASPLIVDGYSIGNFCLIDTMPRDAGLASLEQDMLRDFAGLAVKILVDRRFRLQNQSKQEQLVSTTSHDLMTPLMGLNLSLSVLRDDPLVARKLDAKHMDILHTASTCGDLVSRICKDALDGLRQGISRESCSSDGGGDDDSQSQSQTNRPKQSAVLKLSDFVSRLDHIVRPLLPRVPLLITIDQSAPESIVCDDLKVMRAALGLISSAIKRTTSGAVRFQVFSDCDSTLTFECQDTAPLLDEADATETLYASDVREVRDSSLVFLHVVAFMAREMGGTAGFRQRSDELEPGSITWFRIPIVGAQWPEIDPLSESTPSRPHKQQKIQNDEVMETGVVARLSAGATSKQDPIRCDITGNTTFDLSKYVTTEGFRRRLALVVDDSLVIRKTMCRALSKLGYEAVVAEDGLEGLQALKVDIFDLVFIDFLMPNLDGLDCIRQYRAWEQANRPWFRQHIIGISGHASKKDTEKGSEVGMDGFQAKPIDLKCLKDISESEAVEAITLRLDSLALGTETTGMDEQPCDVSTNTLPKCTSSPKDVPSPENIRPNVAVSTEKQCLVAAPSSEGQLVAASAQLLEQNGWKTRIAVTSEEALELLKSRNWDAVLVDDKLDPDSATACIERFRQWENDTRINAQKNVFMLCSYEFDSSVPSNRRSLIPPSGFQGVLNLRVPLLFQTFEHLVERNSSRHFDEEGTGMDFIFR